MRIRYLSKLFLTIIFFSLVTSLLSPLFSPYLKTMGFSYSGISFIFSIIPLAITLASPIIGKLSDIIGRIRIVRISLLFYALALIFYLLKIKSLIITANVFIAITIIGSDLLLIAKVHDNIKRLRGTYGGIALSLKHTGAIIGPLLGGYLADVFSIESVFVLVIMSAILLSLALTSTKETHSKRISTEDFKIVRSTKNIFSSKELRSLIILGFFVQLNNPLMSIFLPLLIIEDLDLSYLKVGAALSVIGIFFIFQFIFGSISDKIGDKNSIIIGNIITSISLLLISLAGSYSLLLVYLSLFSLGGAFWNPAAYSIMASIGSKTGSIGETMGIYNSIGKIGEFTGYIIAGIILLFLNIRSLFAFGAVMVLIGTALFLFNLPDNHPINRNAL